MGYTPQTMQVETSPEHIASLQAQIAVLQRELNRHIQEKEPNPNGPENDI